MTNVGQSQLNFDKPWKRKIQLVLQLIENNSNPGEYALVFVKNLRKSSRLCEWKRPYPPSRAQEPRCHSANIFLSCFFLLHLCSVLLFVLRSFSSLRSDMIPTSSGLLVLLLNDRWWKIIEVIDQRISPKLQKNSGSSLSSAMNLLPLFHSPEFSTQKLKWG